MADVSYRRLFAEVRQRDNFAAVFRGALEEVAGKVDFSRSVRASPSVRAAGNTRSGSLDVFCPT